MQLKHYHIQVLNEEFSRRLERNARYSLRAFAGHLQIHPSALSRILSGKQKLSRSAAVGVAKRLALGRETSRLFLQSVAEEQFQAGAQELGEAIHVPELKVHPDKINEKDYAVIAQVLCLCVRELTLTSDFQSDIAWIAQRCGCREDEVSKCIDALLRVGLLEKKDGKLCHSKRHLTAVDSKETSEVRARLQKELVERALNSIDKDPFDKRGHYGMTMAIDPKRIPEANRMILDFLERLCDFLESGDRREVYQMAVQLYPLTTPPTGRGSA